MRLGVFLPNWVGDVVMATPALRALRKLAGEGGGLVGVMRPYVAEVLAGQRWFDEEIFYAKRADRAEWSTAAAVRKLRAGRVDRVVLLTNSFRTAWMAWRSGVPERIGYAGQFRSPLLTTRLADSARGNSSRTPVPTIDSYLRLTEAAGCRPESPHLELATTPRDEEAAGAVWQQLGLPDGGPVVVLNQGGAFGITKHWPNEYFTALARRLAVEQGLHVLVNCGPSERNVAREIAGRAGDARVVSLADIDELPIGLTKACIRRSRMVVTTDSGPRFLGVAFGKPVVTLFGPTDPRMTVTHDERETCLSLSLECQPCMARVCPLDHHRCMRELTVERVYAAVVEGLRGDRGHECAGSLATEVTNPIADLAAKAVA